MWATVVDVKDFATQRCSQSQNKTTLDCFHQFLFFDKLKFFSLTEVQPGNLSELFDFSVVKLGRAMKCNAIESRVLLCFFSPLFIFI